MFEVDQAVNTIRAEVDPEAELIFGSIEDENLNGKIRVSIVATSLDGQEPETKPVISMIHRLHNRNVGHSNNLTSTIASNQTTLNATEGATALVYSRGSVPATSLGMLQKGFTTVTAASKTAYTAVPGDQIGVDTVANIVTITLPAGALLAVIFLEIFMNLFTY